MPGPRGPESLAEAVTFPSHGPCPLPSTHDRLEECHYWWHQMAKAYQEPSYFRWSLGAFIQAARNVTWMIQSEKAIFDDFTWYEEWQAQARVSPTLKWLNDTRVLLTKRRALAPTSWARFRCLMEQVKPDYEVDEEEDLYIDLNPFLCTHQYIRSGPVEDHGHEYQRAWEVEELPGRELLDVAAEVYDLVSEVVDLAHQTVGSGMSVVRTDGATEEASGKHHMPCMNETEHYRTIRTYVADGEERWDDSPEHV